MGIMDTLLGRKPAPANARPSASSSSTQYDSQQTGTGAALSVRRDLLKLTLRETLTRNGIPPTWVVAETLRTNTSRKKDGLHVRFQLRHWDPRLLACTVALENEFTERLLLLDPLARNWLAGFSWQFALEDASQCPPLPHPTTWRTPPDATEPAPLSMQASLARPFAPSGVGVIEGPAFTAKPADDVRADLERLLALRDDDARQHASVEQAYAPTRPAML